MKLRFNEATSLISFPSKRLNGLMDFIVFPSTYYHQIFQSIVISNLVNVMYMFRVFQRSSQMFFHNESVLQSPFFTNPNLNITPSMHSFISLWSPSNPTLPNRRIGSFRMWDSSTGTVSGTVFLLTKTWLERFFTKYTRSFRKFFHISYYNSSTIIWQ